MREAVRWGVMSPAKIATEKVIPAMQRCSNASVVAIASRDEARARAAAKALHVPMAFGSYEELLASPDVDAVYIPLPNHLHVPWSVRAIEAGKHVLVEKPIARTAAEVQPLLDAAAARPDVKVMEAFMYRFHPQWRTAKQWIEQGLIGEVRQVHSHFAYRNLDPGNVRNRVETGGGGLLDIGCYDVSLSRFLYGREPERVVATIDHDPTFATDRLTSAILDFGSGATATFSCATQLTPFQRVLAFGDVGHLEIDVPFNAPPCGRIHVQRSDGEYTQQRTFENVDQYTLQGEAFSNAILEGAPVPTPLSDAVANMRVLDAIRASAHEGTWKRI